MTADFGNFVAKTDKNKIWNETNISYVSPKKGFAKVGIFSALNLFASEALIIKKLGMI